VGRRHPIQGVGLGLRSRHVNHILEHTPPVAWFEVLTDNYLCNAPAPLNRLEMIRAEYPMALHGVGLSIGSTDPINGRYLDKVRALVDRLEPAWISDHLCWSSVGSRYVHDLLPLPYTLSVAHHVAERIARVQDYVGCPFLIENVSSYLNYSHSDMTEWEFLTAVAEHAGCGILLDVNNIYVNAVNHGFDAADYLAGVPKARVRQLHLAGFDDAGTHLLDTHGREVQSPVWALYEQTVRHFGAVPTLIEWDTNVPDFETLVSQAARASSVIDHVC
jgi:uncharacterized protein (UPF0276 family)